jgi:hypothetical protein
MLADGKSLRQVSSSPSTGCPGEPTAWSDGTALASWEALSNALEVAPVLRSPGSPLCLACEYRDRDVWHAAMTAAE